MSRCWETVGLWIEVPEKPNSTKEHGKPHDPKAKSIFRIRNMHKLVGVETPYQLPKNVPDSKSIISTAKKNRSISDDKQTSKMD